MKRRILGSAGLGLACALLVAGCGAGQITQTSSQEAALNGARAEVGRIVVRDAELAYPESEDHMYHRGSDAGVLMTIANQGSMTDRLVSASSPAAADVVISGETTVSPSYALVIGPDVPEMAESKDAELVLRGLNRDVRIGQAVPLTLTFRDAGKVTLELPVHVPPERPRINREDDAQGGSH